MSIVGLETIVIGISNKWEVGSEHLSSESATNMMSGQNTWYHPDVYHQVGTIVIGISNKYDVGLEHLSLGSATNIMSGRNTWYHLMSIVGLEQLSS